MLSYLHGFHAGNSADVLKHSLLVFCLSYLKQKEKPLLCVDTHSGSGLYDLGSGENREWESGLGLLLREREKLPAMLEQYINLSYPDSLRSEQQYRGSSVLMARLLKKSDRLVCFEMHPREADALEQVMRTHSTGKDGPSINVRKEDGLAGLKSLLPPPSRRALIFIDPPWEQKVEYENVPRALLTALNRFPEGTYIVWYPLLAQPKEKASGLPLRDTLFGLTDGKRCRVELHALPPPSANSPRGLCGSGLVIYNPPWTLRAACEENLPFLAKVLGGAEANWRFDESP
jgi:23S rRNA (adenine2030-N6)-methyltransferase